MTIEGITPIRIAWGNLASLEQELLHRQPPPVVTFCVTVTVMVYCSTGLEAIERDGWIVVVMVVEDGTSSAASAGRNK